MLVNKFCIFASMLAVACYVSSASASIESASLTSPGDTATLSTFEEGTGVLAMGLPVDVIETAFSSPGVIPIGSYVSSHLIEVEHPPAGTVDYVLTVTFDTDIIGVAYRNSRLDGSKSALDASFGFSAVADSGQINSSDVLTFAANQLTFTVDGRIGGGVDSLRVVTRAVVPEATSLLCWGGLVGLAAFVRKRRVASA